MLGYDFPKCIIYHSIFLKIKNSYSQGAPLIGALCFTAFPQMCQVPAQKFVVRPIA